jgi:hypothetical protein
VIPPQCNLSARYYGTSSGTRVVRLEGGKALVISAESGGHVGDRGSTDTGVRVEAQPPAACSLSLLMSLLKLVVIFQNLRTGTHTTLTDVVFRPQVGERVCQLQVGKNFLF